MNDFMKMYEDILKELDNTSPEEKAEVLDSFIAKLKATYEEVQDYSLCNEKSFLIQSSLKSLLEELAKYLSDSLHLTT